MLVRPIVRVLMFTFCDMKSIYVGYVYTDIDSRLLTQCRVLGQLVDNLYLCTMHYRPGGGLQCTASSPSSSIVRVYWVSEC